MTITPEAVLAAVDETTAPCGKCGGQMRTGIAMGQTYTAGTPDFPSDDQGITVSAGGPGVVIPAMKCTACGWSVTMDKGERG